jgi:glycosyltransferase involved in cell wall biosynthesis
LNILFIDSMCYRSYDHSVLENEGLGGSEASVLRVAAGLQARGHDVSLYQRPTANKETDFSENVRLVGLNSSFPIPDVVVHLRTAKEVNVWRGLWPKAKHLIWLHDLAGDWLHSEPFEGEHVICVSNFHKDTVGTYLGTSVVDCIYNPVAAPKYVQRKPEPMRLGFFSSPHKGLWQVMDRFLEAKKKYRSLEIVVANPGYIDGGVPILPNVLYLGELPHKKVLQAMATCEVLFYPQTAFPETFGLVLAEANSVGTPVLAHDFGAASEVLGAGNEVIDCTKPDNVLKALGHLLFNQPKVGIKPEFLLDAVLDKWENIL